MRKKPDNDNFKSSAAIGIGLICALGAYPAIRLSEKHRADVFPKAMGALIVALVAGVTILFLAVAKAG